MIKILRSSVAVGALAIASTAQAACDTASRVVTCTDASTADQVNAAINRTLPPSVAIVVAPGATVVRSTSPIPSGTTIGPTASPFFAGAISYTNDGIVGTANAMVNFRIAGNIGNASNTFALINRATQNGSIAASNMGGAITANNSGTITGGLDLRSDGAISFVNTGAIYNSNNTNFQTMPAISLISSRIVTEFAPGSTRMFEVGSGIAATIGGTVVQPATQTSVARPQSVSIRGTLGVDLTVTGQAGQISAVSSNASSGNTSTQSISGNTLTLTQASDSRSSAGDVRAVVGATGRVTSLNVFSDGGVATATIDGLVQRDVSPGFALGDGSVSVASTGGTGFSRQTDLRDARTFAQVGQTFSNANTNAGKAVLVEVGATGRTEGSVTARSDAGAVTVRVAGTVGTPAFGGGVDATSRGVNTTSLRNSVNRADGSSESTGSSTRASSGGAATIIISATGSVGGASANGDASATIENAGRIRGGVLANSETFSPSTAESSTQSRTVIVGAAGIRTVVDQTTVNRISEAQGGPVRVVNTATGFIGGSVQASGARSAIIDNAGIIADRVGLYAFSSQTNSVSNNRTSTTTTPVAGGGMITSTSTTASTVDSSRPVSGIAAGTYGGTVGTAPTSSNFSAASIEQAAVTASNATITGTVFGSFTGNAGAVSFDAVNSSSSEQLTQPSGAYTRNTTSGFTQTSSQTASTSTLTIGATGLLADNGSGPGNAALISSGGDADFMLAGGRVTGSVSVAAAADVNSIQTSSSSGSFTRAAAPSPFVFVPEVQQSQVNASAFESRSVRGTASATITGGTIGGDVSVAGTGTGSGTIAASLVLNGTVMGGAVVTAGGRDMISSSNETRTRTGPTTTTRTFVSSSSSAPGANIGNAVVVANGIVGGGIVANSGIGSAMVVLAGRVGTAAQNGVRVVASDVTTRTDTAQTSLPSAFFDTGPLTASRTTSTSVAMGGTAMLSVSPATGQPSASSIEGDVFVSGFSGSTLNVSAGSRLLQAKGNVFVGGNFNTTASDTTGVFSGSVQTGSNATSSGRFSSGLATITTGGTIGSATNQASVVASGVGGAIVRNTGTINGSVLADARGASRATTTTVTDLNNLALRRTISVNVFTAAGGVASIENSALVTGNMSAIAASGTIINTGVGRGGVTLGGSFSNFTQTTTTTTNPVTGANVVTTTFTPAAALFVQTYRLDQNGLLIGGVDVTGASTVDLSGGTTRTSIVNAAVNLNNGSITLGNIRARQTPTSMLRSMALASLALLPTMYRRSSRLGRLSQATTLHPS